MNNKLEYIKERLSSIYKEISLPNEEYIEKKRKEYNLKLLDFDEAYMIKTAEVKGTIEALLLLLEN